MHIQQYVNKIGEKLEFKFNINKCVVKIKGSTILKGLTHCKCEGEGATQEEAIHDYVYKLRGKTIVIDHNDHSVRKQYDVPLNLSSNGRIK